MMMTRGMMLVSKTERVQIAKQRHEANQKRVKELQAQRDRIACANHRRCYISLPQEPCEACKSAGWMLYELEISKDKMRISGNYLRRAIKLAT